MKGARKPPLAASMCSGTCQPFSCLSRCSSASISASSSIWPVKVVPSSAPTAIVLSSTCASTSAAVSVYESGFIGTTRASTSK